MKYILRIVFVVVALLIIFIVFLYSGIYNISAMVPHNKITLKVIHTLTDNSIEHHAKGITAPNLSDSSLIKTGFSHYNEMCVGCHGAPGISRDETGLGLYPKPPDLSKSAKEIPASELFWITKNGIKMTGMPAFGKTHKDDKIWAIVAFMEKLPGMTNEQYKAYVKTVKEMDED
ncbi:MAG: cytochrome c [Ignavibacteriaceae bacterium]|nr:cytochrome c [Ignavibacteriaceae bacterium]